MKKIIFIAIFCMPLLLQAQKGIQWTEGLSWEQVKAKAKAENKYIFLDCYATWCAPCKKMDKEVYINATVGEYFNNRFISVKVQMDKTQNDDNEVKSWYAEAEKIGKEFRVSEMPTFLFFDPGGELIQRGFGYKDEKDFLQLAVSTATMGEKKLYAKLEEYKKGKKDVPQLKDLAIYAQQVLKDKNLAKQIGEEYIKSLNKEQLFSRENIFLVRDVMSDRKLANSLAGEYKSAYLNKLPEDSICTKENLDFIAAFPSVVNTNDRFFKLCYYQPEKVDQVINRKDWSASIVNATVTREEIIEKVLKDGKPVSTKDPAWNRIRSAISKKYKKVDAVKLVLDVQIGYYRGPALDWEKWAYYKNQRIKKYLPGTNNGVPITIELNDGGAWDVFLRCNNKTVLEQSLAWIDLAIKLTKIEEPEGYYFAYLDTKANVLYKLGRVNEAMEVQQEAIDQIKDWGEKKAIKNLDKVLQEYTEVLNTIKKGEPTYLKQGAVWDSNILPKPLKR